MHLISRPADSRFPYLPGIDALRALAVLAVFFYHAGVDWMPGGFLGVDLFFVISGYLITSLLLREFRRGGHVRLGRFWLRRARRLLPAVGVMIAVTMVVGAIVDPDRVDQMRGDAIASLAYVANWHFVYADVSYFDQFQRPSLFTHLWSLAVEEQFYLFWPLLFAAGMKLFGRTRLLLGVAAGALASVALAWILFDPSGDASRVYYGTDTHAVGLLAGVALALVWSPTELRRRRTGPLVGPVLDVVGVFALGFIVLSFVNVHDYDLGLWHGGYLWLALVTALLIAVVVHPASRLGGILGQAPVLWLGLRSYSFYLWHWPVLVLTRPGVDVDLPTELLIPLQLALVLVLSELSYRYVELPFRGQGDVKLPAGWLRVARPALIVGVLAIVAFVGWSGLFASGKDRLDAANAASTAEKAVVVAKPPPKPEPKEPTQTNASPPPATHPPRIYAFGDSVMIGAKEQLAARLGPGFSMNAEVGRQADEFVALVEQLKREGRTPNAVILHMGNNGPLYGEFMEAIQQATGNVGELVLINDHAPVSWIDESNAAIEEAGEDWPHTTVVDWAAAAAAHEDLLWDGIHLKPAAAVLYADLVNEAVREKVSFPPPPKAKAKAKPQKQPRKQPEPTAQDERESWERRLEMNRGADDQVVDAGDHPVAVVGGAEHDR
ncbi:MAG TPA: acyltransferase family protein [Solirubrobacterales bacterium]|nr:acyltransferase family protein [Solirubrobacterales bacterium]